jgi:hypothetical protein
MTKPALEDQILKTDSRGRVLTPVERREALLDEFERSGLSGAKFAALVGLKYQTFSAWATKRRKQRRGEQSPPSHKPAEPVPKLQWVEAVVEKDAILQSQKGEALSVHLPGGARMEVRDAQQAALAVELLRALASQRPLPC